MQRGIPCLWLPRHMHTSYASFPLQARGVCTRSLALTCTRRITNTWLFQAQGASRCSTAQARPPFINARIVRHRLMCTQQGQPSGSSSEAATNSAFTWKGFFAAPWTTVKQQWDKNRAVIKNYGKFAVVLYFTVYVCTLGVLYSAVHFEVIKGPDVNAWINGSSIKKYFTEAEVKLSPFWAEFLTAWALTKTTEPLRIVGTAAALPVVVRYMPARLLQVFGINKAASTAAMGRVVTRAREARSAVRSRVGEVSGHVSDSLSRSTNTITAKMSRNAPAAKPAPAPDAGHNGR